MKKYIVCNSWEHYFAGMTASETCWVLDVEERKLVCGFIIERRWEELILLSLWSLESDVESIVLLDIESGQFDTEDDRFEITDELPEWARDCHDNDTTWIAVSRSAEDR